MLSVKDFNVKLLSLRNMRKLTKTMKMVSATKLRRAIEAVAGALCRKPEAVVVKAISGERKTALVLMVSFG